MIIRFATFAICVFASVLNAQNPSCSQTQPTCDDSASQPDLPYFCDVDDPVCLFGLNRTDCLSYCGSFGTTCTDTATSRRNICYFNYGCLENEDLATDCSNDQWSAYAECDDEYLPDDPDDDADCRHEADLMFRDDSGTDINDYNSAVMTCTAGEGMDDGTCSMKQGYCAGYCPTS